MLGAEGMGLVTFFFMWLYAGWFVTWPKLEHKIISSNRNLFVVKKKTQSCIEHNYTLT